MPDLRPRFDPLSFPLLGMLGALACGPVAPQDTTSGGPSTDSGTDATTTPGTTPGTDPTVDPTVDPTTTDPTRPTTTEPNPECSSDSDCDDMYCGYCIEGRCLESPGCCGYDGAVQIDGKWRCSPPPYCYSDDECDFGYVCGLGCIESQPIPLPNCDPPDGDAASWNLGNAPSAFLLADLDGDGDLDLAAGEPGPASIEIALNDGAGNFVLAGAFGVSGAPSEDLALAASDLDSDGDIDLAVTTHRADGVLHLLFNQGDATFMVGDPRPVGPLPVQVFTADMNGDGALDLLTINEGNSGAGVQFGDGKGLFTAEQPAIAEFIKPRAAVGQFTSDGPADLLAPDPNGAAFSLWAGGQGPLLLPLRTFIAPEAAATMAVLAGDLDLQGAPEIVLVHPDGQTGMAQVWASLAPDAWSFGRLRFTTSLPLTGGLLAELGGLPGPDLIAATGTNSIIMLPGDGNSGFLCEHVIGIAGTSAPALLAVGDVDGDGRLDVIAGGLGDTAVSVIRLMF